MLPDLALVERRRVSHEPPKAHRLTCARGVVVALAVATFCAVPMQGQESTQLAPGPQADPQQRALALQAEGERLARQSRTLLGELRKLEIERELQTERAREASAAVAAAEEALARATARLDDLERRRQRQLPDLKARLVDLYKRGSGANLRLLLGATSVRDFARSTRVVGAMARTTEQRLNAYRALLASAQQERTVLSDALVRLQAQRQAVERGRAAATAAIRDRAALLADIDRRRDLTAQLASELQAASQKLDQQVAAVSSGPAAAANSVGTAGPAATAPSVPARGLLGWPLDGRLIGRFGEPSTRINGASRNGIELEAAEGTPARVTFAGAVVYSAPFSGYGTLVIVDHSGGFHSVYGNLLSSAVKAGDMVEVGQEVGKVGATPGGPPALYFEFRVDGRSVDPLQWLRPR